MIEDQELLALRRRGFWVGPGETEEAYRARVKRCTSSEVARHIPDGEWELGCQKSEEQFGFRPDWIETRIEEGSSGLLFAGAAEVGGGPPIVRLDKKVWRRGRPIPRHELLAHEWLHVARMAFDEPRFEEIIAFQTSRRSWRRFFSPIVQSTHEVIAVALVCFATPFIALMHGPHPLLPLGLLFGLLLARLGWRQWLFHRACQAVTRELAAQLTDREIRRFAFMKRESVWMYIKERAARSLRFRQLLGVGAALGLIADSE